jgi:hypothetical protein
MDMLGKKCLMINDQSFRLKKLEKMIQAYPNICMSKAELKIRGDVKKIKTNQLRKIKTQSAL